MISLLLILRSPDRSKNQVHQHREFLAGNRLKTVLLYRTGIVVCSVAHHLPVAGFLLLRMHMSGLAVPIRILAMFVSRGSALRGFFVVVVILLLGRLAVLFHRCFRLRRRLVLLAGWLFMFLCHGMSP
jgi:hypothetical protein